MKNTKKGFTLVELLVVIAILAILASVAVVGYSAFIGKAEQQQANTEAAQIASALQATVITGDYVTLTVTGDNTTLYALDADHDGKIEFTTEQPSGTSETIDAEGLANGTLTYATGSKTLTYTNTKSGKTATVVVGE